MDRIKKLLLLFICVVGSTGCETLRSSDREPEPPVEDIASTLGCRQDEVAVCMQTNCEPEDYYCTDRGDVRDMFKAGEFRY